MRAVRVVRAVRVAHVVRVARVVRVVRVMLPSTPCCKDAVTKQRPRTKKI